MNILIAWLYYVLRIDRGAIIVDMFKIHGHYGMARVVYHAVFAEKGIFGRLLLKHQFKKAGLI